MDPEDPNNSDKLKRRTRRIAIAVAVALGLGGTVAPLLVVGLSRGYEWWAIAPVALIMILSILTGAYLTSRWHKYLDM